MSINELPAQGRPARIPPRNLPAMLPTPFTDMRMVAVSLSIPCSTALVVGAWIDRWVDGGWMGVIYRLVDWGDRRVDG